MPMTYTKEMVEQRIEECGLRLLGTEEENRDALANYMELRYIDYVDAWEIRTGRPWTTMTKDEAEALVIQRPRLMTNTGILSKLLS